MAKWDNDPITEAPKGKWESDPIVEKVGNVAAGLEGVAQGATFGFSDEIEGGARALWNKVVRGDSRSLGDLYAEGVAQPRERVRAASDTNPWAFHGGEIGSGLLLPGGLARVGIKGALANSAGRGLGGRAVAGAKEGAAYGAAYGAGKAEGGPEATITGAGGGAFTGALFGAALPGALDVAGSVARRATAPFRAVANPQQFAGEKVGEAIARDLSRADGAAGDVGAPRFSHRFSDMSALNPSVRAMDAAGENTRNLMRSAANMPSQAADRTKRILDARQANQHTRITNDLKEGLDEGRNFYEAIDEATKKLDEIGAAAIQPALAKPTTLTPALMDVLERPTMQKVGEKVLLRLQDEGKPLTPASNTEWLHRAKLELDDLIGQSKRAEQMGNTPQAGWDTRTLVTLKKDLLNAIDNPEYKSGLKTYASEARLKSAAEDGFKNFKQMAPEEIRATLSGMDSEAERQIWRMGAMRNVIDDVRSGNMMNDRVKGVFSSPNMSMKLHELFPSQKAYREFQEKLIIEGKMVASRQAIQGNSTTAKQLTQGDQAGKTSRLVMSAMNAATGKLEPMLNMLAQGYNRFSGITPSVANEMLKIGMSKDPGMINALAQQGLAIADRTAASRAGFASALQSGYSAIGAPDPSDPSSAFPRRNALMP